MGSSDWRSRGGQRGWSISSPLPLSFRASSAAAVPTQEHSEKRSDNVHGPMVRSVKCLIWCCVLGLVWGLAEMDGQTGGREERKNNAGGEVG